MVTITSKPKMTRVKAVKPDDNEDGMEEIPFGFNGSPFGDMLKDPNLRKFFKQFPNGPTCRTASPAAVRA